MIFIVFLCFSRCCFFYSQTSPIYRIKQNIEKKNYTFVGKPMALSQTGKYLIERISPSRSLRTNLLGLAVVSLGEPRTHSWRGWNVTWHLMWYLTLPFRKGFIGMGINGSYLIITRSSESHGRSNVTDSLDCPNKFRLSQLV